MFAIHINSLSYYAKNFFTFKIGGADLLRMDLLLKICNNLPLVFKILTPQEKKQIISLMIRTLTYDGSNIDIDLNPVFEKLRILVSKLS